MVRMQILCGRLKLAYVGEMKLHFAFPAIAAFGLGCFLAPALMAQESALEADSISVDEKNGLIEAVGNVRAEADGNFLSTDKIYLDRQAGTMEAPSPLVLREADGSEIKADAAQLDEKLDSGRFSNLRLTPKQGGRFVATQADKTGESLVLDGAVFTACPACETDPTRAPLWQIRAARINYDRAAQDVSYRHSRLEVFGWPVFYLPYMAHAGPEIDRRSGFLAPSLASSNDFGTAVEAPYFFDFAPNYDLTLTPRISEKQDPFLTAEWRHLTRAGQYEFIAYGHSPKEDLLHDATKDQRSGLIGTGRFTLADWKIDIGVQEASDDLFFRSYRINTLSRLENRLRAERRFGNQSLSISTHRYRNTLGDEKEATVDLIAPALRHNIYLPDALWGGDMSVTSSLTHLVRDLGIDTSHAQSTLDWSRRHITQSGFVLTARNRLVLDGYDFTPENDTDQQEKVDKADDFLTANALAIGVAYPLQRKTASDRQTLTPQLQVVAATDNEEYDDLPYISSATQTLTRAQLFNPLATKDEASRVNYGLGHKLALGQSLQTEFFIGQSYNLSDREFTDAKSGYGNHRSALLADWSLAAGPLTLSQKARFDKTGGELLRSETAARLGFSRLSLSASHSFYEKGQTDEKGPTDEYEVLDEAAAALDWQLGKHWRFSGSMRENLEEGETVRADAVLAYEDDCTLLSVDLARDYSRVTNSNIEPETSINFTFTLRTIGQ